MERALPPELPLAPGLTKFLVNARDKKNFKQEDLAGEVGMSGRHYRTWETARRPIPRTRLDDLARALGLDEIGRRQLYRLTGHMVPLPGALSGNAKLLELTERWANVHIHRRSDPACLTDGAWNVVVANDAYFQLFEAVSPHSLNHPTIHWLRWILFHQDAPHMLGKWRDSWMLPTLSQFALAFQNNQTDPQLRRIRVEIAARAELERAYLHKIPELLAQPTEYPDDEDGVVREILAGVGGYASVLLTTAIPSHARDHGFRAVTMSLTAPSGAADSAEESVPTGRQHAHRRY
ncbi:helix-turn-helix transcriptional regulator [Streptomyces sp. BE147]|uniref:helix-turn-helix domain-containing protein n=1 Tax=Streptomyces sp. BE147 TaxID=3002524 RepID=UPI002E764623|nr:helix-turn-helix transcriptional regulator [Streptomyces sp. BE147]MEE1737062.1 helix-turn-helix transcriptional regulator [Streptomyces sp. BE147]